MQGAEQRKHRLRFREVRPKLVAVASVPTEGRAGVPTRLVIEQQQHELERIRESDVIELCGSRERDGGVARVERAAKSPIGRALRCHEHMFAWRLVTRRPPP